MMDTFIGYGPKITSLAPSWSFYSVPIHPQMRISAGFCKLKKLKGCRWQVSGMLSREVQIVAQHPLRNELQHGFDWCRPPWVSPLQMVYAECKKLKSIGHWMPEFRLDIQTQFILGPSPYVFKIVLLARPVSYRLRWRSWHISNNLNLNCVYLLD